MKTDHLIKKARLEELYKKRDYLEKQIGKETKKDSINTTEKKEDIETENYKRERLQRIPGPEQDYAEAKRRADIQYQQHKEKMEKLENKKQKKEFSEKEMKQSKNDSKNNHQLEIEKER